MSKNLVEWVVEEVRDGNVRTQAFQSYEEALDVYNAIKTENKESFVSIQKSEKKLLVE